ncbi:MAG: hypothetical protein IIT85_11590, partial [Prevotella sp.]|nr:hypothetical protein [Prevotella sp.]
LENPGDKTTINYSTYELQYTDYVTVHGKQFRRLHLSRSPYNEQVVWIEGIGGYNIRYRYGYTTSNEKLLGCLLNGKEIFSYKDFSKDKDDVTDYPQILEEGKSWTYKNIDYSNPDNCYEYRYFIDGDTLIRGITYAKLYCENADNKHRVQYKDAVYEAGKTVFIYNKSEHENYIIYSFNENNLHSSNYDIGWSNFKKSSRETITNNGETREVIYFKPNYGSDEIVGCWAEGIGSSVDLVHSKNFQARKYKQLVRCELNGKELFGYEDFGLPEIVVVPDGERLPYHPMLKEGKTWLYKYHHYEEKFDEDNMITGYDEYLTDYSYVLRGDTVINGEQAFKMYRESENGSSVYFAAWIEQDKRIYRIINGETEKTLYYDFNLKRDFLWNDYASGTTVLHHIDTLTVNERKYNLYHFFSYYFEEEYFDWVEGIGDYYEGILENGLSVRPTCVCDYLSFEKCFEDGVQIYPQVIIPNAISSIPSSRKDDETVYDLQGRIVTTPQRNGLYIKNGKKFIAR